MSADAPGAPQPEAELVQEEPRAPETSRPRKEDPETLVLREPQVRITRFRRGAIIGLATIACVTISILAWTGLRPASFRLAASGEELVETPARAPDSLAAAPRTYGDVPRLGPPLPGDLGRPILAHQRRLESEAQMSAGDPLQQAEEARRRADALDAERQRIAAERVAARESSVLMALAPRGRDAAAPVQASPAPAVAAPAEAGGARDLPGPAAESADVSAHRLAAPASRYMLGAGSIIAASLITGLNSDLPGFVTAQVTENAYDSVTGRVLLIPQGSRLIGTSDNAVGFGQSRALILWQRIVLPDGSSIRIDDTPATDEAGRSGLFDRVDRHGWQLLRGVVLSTLLGVGAELSFGSAESGLVRALRESAQQNGARAGDQLVGRSIDIRPTLEVRPGWPLRVVVHKDIVLEPWRG